MLRLSKRFFKPAAFLTALLGVAGLTGISPVFAADNVESRLASIEAKQDSILALLKTMASQNEFVALRVGWKPPADTAPVEIPVGKSFTEGPSNAVVTLVEFSDLQCPYCAQLSPTIDAIVRDYPKDVRLVYKHFPLSFHSQARAAAAAAIAAGNQGKFFEFRTKLAPRFRELSEDLYLSTAKELGLDMARFKREMVLTPEINKLLDADIQLGQQVGVEGTPTVFINGRLAEDRSYEYFAGQIAKAKVAAKGPAKK